MSDIFVSYARSTAAQAQQIADALRARGYGVWRDDELPAHRVWSAEAAKSEWVRSEADRARTERKLVQLSVDRTPLPMPFDQIQCADLSGWTGDREAPGWRKVVASIEALMGGASVAPAPATRSERAGVSICVLPFANMSGDQEQEYFSDGISEDIITDLSKVSSLSVIARNSAFTFKGKHVDLLQVARQLKVTHILEGSVRKSGNRVRITAQLIDGATNDHVWAERYDRDLADIFALQDEISQAIVGALKIKLFPEEKKVIEYRGTSNVEAFDLYLRARDLSRQFGLDQSRRAIEIYRRAIDLDPKFALAWAGLGIAWANIVIRAPETAKAALKEMDVALERTALLAPDLALGHAANGFRLVAHRDWLGTEAAYARAFELGTARELSGLPGGSEYAFFLTNVGRFDEAAQLALASRALDPLSLALVTTLQYTLDGAGRHAEAEAEYLRGQDITGDRTTSEYWAMLRAWETGPRELALERERKHVASGHLFAFYPHLLEVLDKPVAALALVRSAFEVPAYQDPSRMSILSHWAAHCGDTELALSGLRRAYVDLGGITFSNVWFPVQKQTRRLPGFKALLRDLGLVDYWRKSGKWGDFARPVGADDFDVFR
jgi:TolB-like protein